MAEALAHVRPPIVLTGADGRFCIPEEYHWIIYIAPVDLIMPVGTLVVRREGYTGRVMELGGTLSCCFTKMGEIALEPKKE
jgi:hypothetical protein